MQRCGNRLFLQNASLISIFLRILTLPDSSRVYYLTFQTCSLCHPTLFVLWIDLVVVGILRFRLHHLQSHWVKFYTDFFFFNLSIVYFSEGPPVIISPPTGFSLAPSPSIPSAVSHAAGLSPLHSASFISVRSPSSEGRISTDYVITADKDADDKRNQRETRPGVYKTKAEQTRSPSPRPKTGSSNKAIQVSMIVTPRSTHSNLSWVFFVIFC